MVLGTVVDSNVLSYPVLIIMKGQGADIRRGRASPRMLGGAEPALGRRARQNKPSAIGRGGVWPQTSDEAESAPGRQARWSLSWDIERGRASP